MASAGEWVRGILASAGTEPMPTEAVWKSLEKHAGQGDKAFARVKDVLAHIDQALIERQDSPAMRSLWAAVTGYLEKVQEGLAAA